MTTKPTVDRFRLRRPDPAAAPAAAPPKAPRPEQGLFLPDTTDDGFGDEPFPTARGSAAPATEAPVEIDAIRREGLTGRQLRMARRVAQKHGLPATSDFDAVRLLRKAGIDPFAQSSVLDLVTAEGAPSRALTTVPGDGIALPQTIKPAQLPSTERRAEESHIADILRIQQDIARRRRRKLALLGARLAFFVMLPTLLAGWYYYVVATPLYATKTEFVIQQADSAKVAGLGGLFSGTQFATSQDSIAVQGYMQSREAMSRLDADQNFRAHFSADTVDPIQRLDPHATLEQAYRTYQRNVKIAYDPSDGVIKMEVIAPDPATSVAFSQALIGYAEEQVDHLTQRLREDQMEGAQESYQDAEAKMLAAQRRVVELQEKFKVMSSEVEVSLLSAQIGQLESLLSQDRLSLAQMEGNPTPNPARMEPLKRRIAALETEIAGLRAKMTTDDESGASLASIQGELGVAHADVQTRQLLLAQSLQQLESARIEANRQVRYLSLSVSPTAPDEPTYPRAFENTAVAFFIFAGIYLMISMTVAILREQVTA
ncbi:MAG: capsule biosynthesis protein [Paracoccaceae bacterium]